MWPDGASAGALLASGLAGGVVTAVVGGASLITFPALLAAGLAPVIANASNTVALAPGNLVAALADRERMPAWDRSLLSLVAIAMLGSVAGAVLLLLTPERAFTALVPVLIGAAKPRCSRAPTASGAGSPRGPARGSDGRRARACSCSRRSRCTAATSGPG